MNIEIPDELFEGLPLIGELKEVPFYSDPLSKGWRVCNGDSLDIDKNPDLYKLLGKSWGGTETTFNLPVISTCPTMIYVGGLLD